MDNFINTIQLWRQDKTKPKLKDFLCIRESEFNGFPILIQTLTQHKITIFKHYFGHNEVEAADDLKGVKEGLDIFEMQLDLNVDDFYKPPCKGLKCMEDDVLQELYEQLMKQEKDIPIEDSTMGIIRKDLSTLHLKE